MIDKKIRIIPRPDIKGENVVKGVHLEGLRVLGSPCEFALRYYESGADEIIFMDSVASLYGRNNLHKRAIIMPQKILASRPTKKDQKVHIPSTPVLMIS